MQHGLRLSTTLKCARVKAHALFPCARVKAQALFASSNLHLHLFRGQALHTMVLANQLVSQHVSLDAPYTVVRIQGYASAPTWDASSSGESHPEWAVKKGRDISCAAVGLCAGSGCSASAKNSRVWVEKCGNLACR